MLLTVITFHYIWVFLPKILKKYFKFLPSASYLLNYSDKNILSENKLSYYKAIRYHDPILDKTALITYLLHVIVFIFVDSAYLI